MSLKDIVDEVLAKHDAECLRLTEQLNKTIIERDEARRLACEYYTMEGSSSSGSEAYCKHYSTIEAKTRGWDCYKKEETQ